MFQQQHLYGLAPVLPPSCLKPALRKLCEVAAAAAEPFAAAALVRLEDWSELEGMVDPAAAGDDDQLSENVLSNRFTAALHGITPTSAQVSPLCLGMTIASHEKHAWFGCVPYARWPSFMMDCFFVGKNLCRCQLC